MSASGALPELEWSTTVEDRLIYSQPAPELAKVQTSPQPKARPFSFDSCLAAFIEERDEIPTKFIPVMSATECHFWFWAVTDVREDLDAVEATLRERDYETLPSLEDAAARFKEHCSSGLYFTPNPSDVVPLLGDLFNWSETVELLTNHVNSWSLSECIDALPPCPNDQEREKARGAAVRYLETPNAHENACGSLLKHFDHAESAERYLTKTKYWLLVDEPGPLFRQLKDAKTAYKALRRLKVSLTASEIHQFLAHFGYTAVDLLVLAASPDELDLAALIRSTHAVAAWLELAAKPKTADMAEHWLVHEGANAIDGMLNFLGRRGKKRDVALAMLAKVVANGHEATVQELAKTKSTKLQAALQEEVIGAEAGPEALPTEKWPAWMTACAATKLSSKVQKLLGPATLRPVLLADSESRVPDEVMLGYLSGIAGKSEPADVPVHLDADSAAAMAWDLIVRWTAQSSGDAWPFRVVALLGGADEAAKLGRMTRRGGFTQPAAAADALRKMASPEALTALTRAYDHNRHRVLNTRGFNALLADHGFTDNEDGFRDSIVPSCGLSDLHVIRLDFGKRVFLLALTPPAKVLIVDRDSGEVFQKFPPRRKADDAAKHKAARETYMVFKVELAEVVEQETRRLLEAMLSDRQWTRQDWLERISRHPVMGPLACTLVWKTEIHGTTTTFMPTHPDDSCIRNNYDETPLGERISLFHPADAPSQETEQWRTLLADSEIVQPFEQLARPTYRPGSDASNRWIQSALKHIWPDRALGDALRKAGYWSGETNDNNDWLYVERETGDWAVRITLTKPLPRWPWPPSAPEFSLLAIEFWRDEKLQTEVPASIYSEMLAALAPLTEGP